MTKIMLIDDDKLVTDLMQKLLKSDGFDTVAVNDSSLAIEVAKLEIPDLILLDLMMPQPDGFRVCRMLREEELFKNIPIIIVTALDDRDSRKVAFGAGATDYLTKPFQPSELLEKILKTGIELPTEKVTQFQSSSPDNIPIKSPDNIPAKSPDNIPVKSPDNIPVKSTLNKAKVIQTQPKLKTPTFLGSSGREVLFMLLLVLIVTFCVLISELQ